MKGFGGRGVEAGRTTDGSPPQGRRALWRLRRGRAGKPEIAASPAASLTVPDVIHLVSTNPAQNDVSFLHPSHILPDRKVIPASSVKWLSTTPTDDPYGIQAMIDATRAKQAAEDQARREQQRREDLERLERAQTIEQTQGVLDRFLAIMNLTGNHGATLFNGGRDRGWILYRWHDRGHFATIRGSSAWGASEEERYEPGKDTLIIMMTDGNLHYYRGEEISFFDREGRERYSLLDIDTNGRVRVEDLPSVIDPGGFGHELTIRKSCLGEFSQRIAEILRAENLSWQATAELPESAIQAQIARIKAARTRR